MSVLVDYPPGAQPGGVASTPGGGFSPLHLFECTITNAGMLVDSMATRELVSALRILTGLHSRIVEVMEPSVDVACQLADVHRAHCSQSGFGGGVGGSQPGADKQPSRTPPSLAEEAAASSVETKPRVKTCPFEDDQGQDDEDDDDDDCVMLFEEAGDGAVGCEEDEDELTVLRDSRAASARAPKAGRASAAAASAATAAVTSVSSLADEEGNRLIGEVKATLKQCYKEMKGSGTHLFDFTRPFEDPANMKIANSVIGFAQARVGNFGLPILQWRDICSSLMQSYRFHRRDNRKWSRWKSKLARRQKALECVLSDLNATELEQYRLVLSREFTTSDEESADEHGRVTLRPRELAWESDRVRDIKRRLDELFLQRFATRKQRAEIERQLQRDRRQRVRSSRQPPDRAPAWALRPEYGGAAASGYSK